MAFATAGIHLYLFLIEGFLGDSSMLPFYQILFVGIVLAYVTLAVALVFVPALARLRPVIRVLLISIAVASIIAYIYVDVIDALGNTDKVIEVLLIALVTVDAAMSSRSGN